MKSREAGFFYGHPQNRFWKVLASLYGEPLPASIQEKTDFLLNHHIALFDVAKQCDILNSSDSSIKNVVPNDISVILNAAEISAIYTNGRTANNLYKKYIFPVTGIEAIPLPSTSAANAAYSIERLIAEWCIIVK